MQRIESTAHHPPAGWDPLVGHGTVDALAAVSTDSAPPADTSAPAPASVAITTPAAPTPPDPQARNTAFGGAAICLVALLAALGIGAATGRSRRSRDRIPGD
jgi:membrane-anchored mycosin MYCP